MEKQQWRQRKAMLSSDRRYPRVFARTVSKLRELGINGEMPGYTLLALSCCIKVILEMDEMDEIFDLLEKITIIPSIDPVIKDIRAEEQWLKEALRSAGIGQDVDSFICDLSEMINDELH